MRWKRFKVPSGELRVRSDGDPKTRSFAKRLATRLRASEKADLVKAATIAARPLPDLTPQPYLVAFIDILGFGREIEEANTKEQLEHAYKKLRFVQKEFDNPSATDDRVEQLGINNDYGRRVIALSDSVVVAITPNCTMRPLMGGYDLLGLAIYDLIVAQARCACNGIFVRGGISHGPFFFEDDILLSPALARAYELEHKFAHHPLIVIPDSTRRLILNFPKKGSYAPGSEPNPAYFWKLDRQWRGEDLYFLNYMRIMVNTEHRGWLPKDFKEYQAARKRNDDKRAQELINRRALKDAAFFLGWHKKRVLEAYNAAPSEEVREKYRWLMGYHNTSFLRNLPYLKSQAIDMRRYRAARNGKKES